MVKTTEYKKGERVRFVAGKQKGKNGSFVKYVGVGKYWCLVQSATTEDVEWRAKTTSIEKIEDESESDSDLSEEIKQILNSPPIFTKNKNKK